ncbi:HAD family phosphatase [Candidatus Poribacteria bacterium]|nr:HAD family phosphatase [Candidatus Poribacteria bacterium]
MVLKPQSIVCELKPQLIVCDWEGCISSPGGGRIPWPTQAISDLCELVHRIRALDGPPLIICTGRQAPYTEAALQALNAFWDYPSVCENGCFLYYPRTKEYLINPAITEATEQAMPEIRREVSALIRRLRGVRELGKEYCFSANPPPGMSPEQLCTVILEELPQFGDLIEITYSGSAVDITPKGVSKGSGVRYLSEVTSIPRSEMLGVGDSAGDLSWLEIIGHPTAPVNASAEVKNIAEYVSPYEVTRGTIDIIRRYTGIL